MKRKRFCTTCEKTLYLSYGAAIDASVNKGGEFDIYDCPYQEGFHLERRKSDD